MAFDKFENLPGIIHELQDGGLQISETSAAPSVLILGTSAQGTSGTKTQVVRAQESENQFGREGTLVRGMYETIAGGSTNTYLLRINTRSAILYGVGTDDQVTNPTAIETLIKDGSAADMYYVRYTKPATLGPNAIIGRLKINNASGILVYDNNPGGQPIDLGEVIVSGDFTGGEDIGSLVDTTDFVSFRDLAQDKTEVTNEVTGSEYLLDVAEVSSFDCPVETALAGKYFTLSSPTTDYYVWYDVDASGAADPAPGGTGIKVDVVTGDGNTGVATKTAAAIDLVADFGAISAIQTVTVTNAAIGDVTDLADGDAGISNISITQGSTNAALTVALVNDLVIPGTIVVYIDGQEIASTSFTHDEVASPDEITIDAGLTVGGAVTVDYVYDADADYNLRDGSDGLNPSRMELYEALEEAYRSLENDEIDIVIPMDIYLDDSNVVEGSIITLSSDPAVSAGRHYPIPGSKGDALGKIHVEEYQGEFYYFWDIDSDGEAEIYPSVGLASSTTKIDGTNLSTSDFHEVNFAYQLSNFCFSLSVNDNECTGVIGTRGPKSFSAKDISLWIGEEPTFDADGVITANGSGLLGNKFVAGSLTREKGFFATYSGFLPTSSSFDLDADIVRDRNGKKVDIGKYISLPAMYLTFFNPVDETGFGYQANMASLYGGFYSALPSNSAPTNKEVTGIRAPFRISKTKLNSLAKYKYIAIKQKENKLRISDAPTAATDASDFTRLTTVRIISDVVDAVRAVAEPYIGEPNTALSRVSLETGITRELSLLQEGGLIQRFEARVTATTTQEIQGDSTVELTIVPAFELRKITIITSLAKQ